MALGDDLNLGLVSLVKQGMLDNAPKNLGGIYGTDLTEAERAANIQDISKAEGTPLYGIPEFDRLQYAARNYRSMPSLYEMYLSKGFPKETAATDTAQIPGAIDTLVNVGGGAEMGATPTPGTGLTNFEQNLVDQGIGVQASPGAPVGAAFEEQLNQKAIDDLANYPVTLMDFPKGDAGLAELIAAEDRKAKELADEQAAIAREQYMTGQTPIGVGGEATPGAEFAAQNPYGGTGTMDDLGADTFDTYQEPTVANLGRTNTGVEDYTAGIDLATGEVERPSVPFDRPTIADVAGPVTLSQQDVIDTDANIGFKDVSPEAKNDWNQVRSGVAKVGDFVVKHGLGVKNILEGALPIGTIGGAIIDSVIGGGDSPATTEIESPSSVPFDRPTIADVSGPQVVSDKNIAPEFADVIAADPDTGLTSQELIDYQNLTNELEGQEIKKTGNPEIGLIKEEEIKQKALKEILDKKDGFEVSTDEYGDRAAAQEAAIAAELDRQQREKDAAQAAAARAKAAADAQAAANARAAAAREAARANQYASSYGSGDGRDSSGTGGGWGGSAPGGGWCFDPNTFVQMADGSEKKIKEIQLGDNTKGGEVTGVFQFKAADEIHDYKGVIVAGSHYVKEDGKFIMVQDSPISVKIDKIPVVHSLDTTGKRIFIKGIEFADYNGDGIAKGFLHNAGVPLEGFDKEVLRQVENRLI